MLQKGKVMKKRYQLGVMDIIHFEIEREYEYEQANLRMAKL